MSKFKLENSALFGGNELPEEAPVKRRPGRPMSQNLVRDNAVQEGLTPEYTRATFIMKVELLERLKDYAYSERIHLKDAVNELLETALADEERRIRSEGRDIIKRGGK